jgi:hypothetical protein
LGVFIVWFLVACLESIHVIRALYIDVSLYLTLTIQASSRLKRSANQQRRLSKEIWWMIPTVTRLPKFASIESLYFETGWEPLHSRRHSRKLNLFYKIRNNDRPLYLYDCLLPFIREENKLNMRNQTELVFNATFSNISAISWPPVLVVEEAGVPGENHRPWASNWFLWTSSLADASRVRLFVIYKAGPP